MDSMDVFKQSYLQITHLKFLENWSVRYLLETRFSYNQCFDLVPIGSFLFKSRNKVSIEDEKIYQRVTVKINNGGVVPRDTEKGSKIGTKQQYQINAGQFLMSKIDARNGAFGLVPDILEGAIVTNDFPVFDVDKKVINPEFLVLTTTTKEFKQFAQSCSSGTTNRQRIDIDLFLNVKIPLPSLLEQNRVVEAYNRKIQLAENQEKEVQELKNRIQEYLSNALGIENITIQPFKKGIINLFSYKNTIDRWDVHKGSLQVFSSLYNSKYPVEEISSCFAFINRRWNKKKYENNTFNYIELGAVDPFIGVTETKEIKIENAPSRATQFVKEGDLIIGTTRPYLKRFAIIKNQNDSDVASSGFQVIAPSNKYNLEFLLEYLKSDFGIRQFEFYMTGALYPAITAKDLKKILIPLPPIEIQNKIAEDILKIKSIIKTSNTQAVLNRKHAIEEFENEIFTK